VLRDVFLADDQLLDDPRRLLGFFKVRRDVVEELLLVVLEVVQDELEADCGKPGLLLFSAPPGMMMSAYFM